ncbi:hypothetical protein ACFQ3S_05500, partial [Mucilaginibacter terrae]|uniref:hypothetical protein n=1 Tax=Mucilaginibacter terrae TaxID=1955052 RepID=UPI003631AE58
THGSTPENKEFLNWAVEFLMANPTLYNQAFKDLLNGVFNEYSPIYLPTNFDITYDQDWYDAEDSFALIGNELQQQGLTKTDPIPEMYYKNGTPIDMRPATPRNGLTAKGAPRSLNYFWKELAKKRPEMFNEENRNLLKANKSPKVNEQWIKYNPTHKSYMGNKLIHHHDEQGFMAYAIPEKVHQKWSSILHRYKLNGKIPRIGGTLISLLNVMQVFSTIMDVNSGNPDAWINWFGGHNEMGKIYIDPMKNVYWEIMDQTITKNSSGIPMRAIVHYYVYADYIWDSDENRYMGINKLAEFTEDLDLNNKISKEVIKTWM